MTHSSRTILRGRDVICAYLGGMNIQTVKKLVQLGMSVRTDGGNWYAHADNLEEWLRNLSFVFVSLTR